MTIFIDHTQLCQSTGAPFCLQVPDPEFTMYFDDLGEDPIYFCSVCGPTAVSVTEALYERLEADPDLAGALTEMFDEIDEDKRSKSS